MTGLVLASASQSRRRLLENAGVAFTVDPASLDEDAIIESMEADGTAPGEIADTLASLKSQTVSTRQEDRLVAGSDQVLVVDGKIYSKPADEAAARDRLKLLRGRNHSLITSVTLAKQGSVIWCHREEAHLTMRDFSDTFLDGFVARGMPSILSSTGAYQLEGEGIQLFSRIDGDYFSILGLPLLALLSMLREHNLAPR